MSHIVSNLRICTPRSGVN